MSPSEPAAFSGPEPAAEKGPAEKGPAASPEPADRDEGGFEDDEAAEGGETRQVRAPWHFKVILVGSVVYIGYRIYQGVGWLIHHI